MPTPVDTAVFAAVHQRKQIRYEIRQYDVTDREDVLRWMLTFLDDLPTNSARVSLKIEEFGSDETGL